MDFDVLKKEVRAILLSPDKHGVYKINSQALIKTWPKREQYLYLFDAIDEKIPFDISLKDKIHLILEHDGRYPNICFSCENSENVKKRKDGQYLCDDCAKTRKRDKTVKTNMKKYGVPYQISSKSTKQKTKETLEKRYGVSHNMHVTDFARKQGFTKRKNKYTDEQIYLIENSHILYNEYVNDKVPLYHIANKYGFGVRFLGLLFQEHGYKITTSRGYSFEQESFANSISEKFSISEIETNTRKIIAPKEIDIWMPSHNLGIEYHGLYWHDSIDDFRCHEKYLEAKKNGIQLLQFFDFEVENNFNVVQNIIRSKLHMNERKLNARDCTIEEIDYGLHKQFCDKYHLQEGHVRPNMSLGLFLKNELLSVMSFGKSRYNGKYEWELLRYASLPNTTVRGGASKLLKRFEITKNPDSLCSYADCRISEGSLYNSLGFNLIHHSGPNYFYYKRGEPIIKRYKAQKHKLKNILGVNFDPRKTERDNMEHCGYKRINDAGMLLYGKYYDEKNRSIG